MGKINIDFRISSDLYFIKIADYSDWELIANKPSIIEITLPGDSTPVTKYFDKYKTNIFNSNTLGANCLDCENVPLQDGIYIIKVIGSPSTFFKEVKYLKTDQLQMEIDKIYIDSFGDAERENISNKLTEIEFWLKSAESHLRFDMEREARMMYEQAAKMVDKLKNCKSCK